MLAFSVTTSMLALAASVLAVLYARRSAQAAREMANNDSARHHEQRRPQWAVQLEHTGSGPGAPCRLTLELTSKEPVDHVRLTSTSPNLVFAGDQEGSPAMGTSAESVRPVQPGARTTAWRVVVPDPSPGGEIRTEMTVTIGQAQWRDWVDVALPPPPPRVVAARMDRTDR